LRLEQQPRVLSGTRTESRVGNNGRDVLMSRKTWMSRVTGRRYDHREVGGRVAPGAATESSVRNKNREQCSHRCIGDPVRCRQYANQLTICQAPFDNRSIRIISH